MRDFSFPEAADKPNDKYDYGNDNEYADSHTSLENITDYLTTCKGAQQQRKNA